MKHLKPLSVLFISLLAAPSLFAAQNIPWQWDDEEQPVVKFAPPAVGEAEETFTSDIGW